MNDDNQSSVYNLICLVDGYHHAQNPLVFAVECGKHEEARRLLMSPNCDVNYGVCTIHIVYTIRQAS